jgi:cytochrome c553
MKRRFLFLLVAVLLLRGWAGEAMAGQMLATQLQALATAQQVHGEDCAEAMVDEAADALADCASCVQCHDCTLNALPAMAAQAHPELPQALIAAPPPAYASAEPRQGFKPPKA